MKFHHSLYILFVVSLFGFLYYYYSTDEVRQIESYTYENGSLHFNKVNDVGVKTYELKFPKEIELKSTDKLSFAYLSKKASIYNQPNDTIKFFVNDKLVFGDNDKMELVINFKSNDKKSKYEFIYKS